MGKVTILLSLSLAVLVECYVPMMGGMGMGGMGMMGGGAMMGGGGGMMMGGPMMMGYGGEMINNNHFSGGKKMLEDGAFKKANEQQGGEFHEGKEGFNKGIAAMKKGGGASGFVNDAAGGKKMAEDAKKFYGGQHFDKEGKQGGQFQEKKGHKKGHVIKSFKNSHHKDEADKHEEYFDEENDEGSKVNYNGQYGNFGEKGASAFKGGHENGEFAEGAKKKQGHFVNEAIIDNNNAGHGNYGEKKFGAGGSMYGVNNGKDINSMMGHHEAGKFYKHIPFYG